MKIYSWNVNGLRAVHKKGQLQALLNTHAPDIICFQETKATSDQIEMDLPSHEEHWCSADRRGYSGTAIFTKFSPLSARCGLPESVLSRHSLADDYGDAAREGRVTTLEFETFFVVSVYTPNAKDDLSRLPLRAAWDKALLTYIKELEQKKPIVLGGDFNVAHTELDLARPGENEGKKGFTKEERVGFTAFLESGFVDTFRRFESGGGHYTWWSHFAAARERNIGWRIDYILLSPRLLPFLQAARIHSEVYGSDHCPISITLAV
jgi:exodeoxyribonuclease-3